MAARLVLCQVWSWFVQLCISMGKGALALGPIVVSVLRVTPDYPTVHRTILWIAIAALLRCFLRHALVHEIILGLFTATAGWVYRVELREHMKATSSVENYLKYHQEEQKLAVRRSPPRARRFPANDPQNPRVDYQPTAHPLARPPKTPLTSMLQAAPNSICTTHLSGTSTGSAASSSSPVIGSDGHISSVNSLRLVGNNENQNIETTILPTPLHSISKPDLPSISNPKTKEVETFSQSLFKKCPETEPSNQNVITPAAYSSPIIEIRGSSGSSPHSTARLQQAPPSNNSVQHSLSTKNSRVKDEKPQAERSAYTDQRVDMSPVACDPSSIPIGITPQVSGTTSQSSFYTARTLDIRVVSDATASIAISARTPTNNASAVVRGATSSPNPGTHKPSKTHEKTQNAQVDSKPVHKYRYGVLVIVPPALVVSKLFVPQDLNPRGGLLDRLSPRPTDPSPDTSTSPMVPTSLPIPMLDSSRMVSSSALQAPSPATATPVPPPTLVTNTLALSQTPNSTLQFDRARAGPKRLVSSSIHNKNSPAIRLYAPIRRIRIDNVALESRKARADMKRNHMVMKTKLVGRSMRALSAAAPAQQPTKSTEPVVSSLVQLQPISASETLSFALGSSQVADGYGDMEESDDEDLMELMLRMIESAVPMDVDEAGLASTDPGVACDKPSASASRKDTTADFHPTHEPESSNETGSRPTVLASLGTILPASTSGSPTLVAEPQTATMQPSAAVLEPPLPPPEAQRANEQEPRRVKRDRDDGAEPRRTRRRVGSDNALADGVFAPGRLLAPARPAMPTPSLIAVTSTGSHSSGAIGSPTTVGLPPDPSSAATGLKSGPPVVERPTGYEVYRRGMSGMMGMGRWKANE
ncbi:hypothetical protein RhiJN_10655 [Ceratobasidium sp. AG-Ba]|nr:hypothetical protein RhiJN_10655 [Ceratobasidium sp. AG-Ba]